MLLLSQAETEGEMPRLAINTHEGNHVATAPRKLQAQVTAGIPVETEEERQRRIYEQVQGSEAMHQEGSQAPSKPSRQAILESKSQQPRKAKPAGGKKLSRKQLARKQKAMERGEAYCSQQEVVELDKNKLQQLNKGRPAAAIVASSEERLVGSKNSSVVGNVVRTDKKKKRSARRHKAY